MGRWRISYRSLGWLALAVTVLLTVRVAIGVAATPSDLWSLEFSPLTVMASGAASPRTASRAAALVQDPAVARSLIGGCVVRSASPAQLRECLAAVDYGLAAVPTSSELWLARARLLVAQGVVDDRMVTSLSNSYAAGRYEGWIAADRLPFSLRIHQLLPPEMIDDIGVDIQLVLSSKQLSGPLIDAYIDDPFLREATWSVIEQFASLDQQERLIAWIRQEL